MQRHLIPSVLGQIPFIPWTRRCAVLKSNFLRGFVLASVRWARHAIRMEPDYQARKAPLGRFNKDRPGHGRSKLRWRRRNTVSSFEHSCCRPRLQIHCCSAYNVPILGLQWPNSCAIVLLGTFRDSRYFNMLLTSFYQNTRIFFLIFALFLPTPLEAIYLQSAF